MCQISFNINVQNNEEIIAAEGRYKLQGAVSFEPVFTINDINNPITPDITIQGDYNLEIRVQGTNGIWSDWFATTIRVDTSCAISSIGIYIKQGNCNDFPIDNNDILVYVDNINISNGSILYSDAALTIPYAIPNNNISFIYADAGNGIDETIFNISVSGEVQNLQLCSEVTPDSIPVTLYQVTDCNDGFPLVGGLNVFIPGTTEEITTSTIFYTTPDLDVPYDGGSNRYRAVFSTNVEPFRGWHESFIVNNLGEASSLNLCLQMTISPENDITLNSYIGQLNIQGTGIDQLDIEIITAGSISSFGTVFNNISNMPAGVNTNVAYQTGNNSISGFVFANSNNNNNNVAIVRVNYKAYINGNFAGLATFAVRNIQ